MLIVLVCVPDIPNIVGLSKIKTNVLIFYWELKPQQLSGNCLLPGKENRRWIFWMIKIQNYAHFFHSNKMMTSISKFKNKNALTLQITDLWQLLRAAKLNTWQLLTIVKEPLFVIFVYSFFYVLSKLAVATWDLQ